jgi:hypothetical protein
MGCTLYAPEVNGRSAEKSMQNFLDWLVRSTKTVMTRVELGGTLFLVAIIGVLLTSREEGSKSE